MLDNIRHLPEFKKILSKIESNFWENHDKIKESLEEKRLLYYPVNRGRSRDNIMNYRQNSSRGREHFGRNNKTGMNNMLLIGVLLVLVSLYASV